jgi:hypothetical protein
MDSEATRKIVTEAVTAAFDRGYTSGRLDGERGRARYDGPKDDEAVERAITKALLQLAGQYEESDDPRLVMPISEFNLSVLTYNALHRSGIRIVKQLLALTETSTRTESRGGIKDFGQRGLREVDMRLAELGLQRAAKVD